MKQDLLYDPSVFRVGCDYQIIFRTKTKGLGWVEIDGARYTDEECGLLKYGTVHKISVPGVALDEKKKYTVVFIEYKEKPPYFPKGVETVRKEYSFIPCEGEDFTLFQFADTHGAVITPLEAYRKFVESRGGRDADVIVLNGDINDSSDTVECFDVSFALAGEAVHGTRPVLYSRGNHDTRGHAAELLPDYIPTAFREGRRETFYTFRLGSLWGIVLDCGEDKYDTNEEYGGTVYFDNFRRRETAYLESVLADAENEWNAPGVTTRIALCHVPFVEHFKFPFDVGGEYYEKWTRILSEMNTDLLVCGHMHRAYFVQPHTEGCRDADFPTAVMSIPVHDENGRRIYTGGAVVKENGERYAAIVSGGDVSEKLMF